MTDNQFREFMLRLKSIENKISSVSSSINWFMFSLYVVFILWAMGYIEFR